jgi:hypothetical protein
MHVIHFHIYWQSTYIATPVPILRPLETLVEGFSTAWLRVRLFTSANWARTHLQCTHIFKCPLGLDDIEAEQAALIWVEISI